MIPGMSRSAFTLPSAILGIASPIVSTPAIVARYLCRTAREADDVGAVRDSKVRSGHGIEVRNAQ